MSLDFTEIAPAHKKSSGIQLSDSFELFTRSFLRALGYRVVDAPARGADGGCDLIVVEQSQISRTEIRWLVSCKHKAHSGAAVNSRDEENLQNRLSKANCNGFLWFYSTLPTNSLNNDFTALINGGYKVTGYDKGEIEQLLLDDTRPEMISLTKQYFPKSYRKWKEEVTNITACVTLEDLSALARLRSQNATSAATLKMALAYRKVNIRMAPWVWSEVVKLSANASTERLHEGIKEVVSYFEISALDAPITLIAQDFYNVAMLPRPAFDAYVRKIEQLDITKFIAHLKRQLTQTKSTKSLVQAIGDILGLKPAELKILENSRDSNNFPAQLRLYLEALQPTAQLVSMLLIDGELSDRQRIQRSEASLSFSSVPTTIKKHYSIESRIHKSPLTLDQRVYHLLTNMATEWAELSLDRTTFKVSDVAKKFPHIRSMLSYLFGIGKGFRPLLDCEMDRTKTMFYLIYAPDCAYLSVAGQPLAGRIKHGLISVTHVGERKTFWGPVLRGDIDSQDHESLLKALEQCYF